MPAGGASNSSPSKSTLSAGAKAGIGIGAAVVGLLLIAILLYHLRRRGAKNSNNNVNVPQFREPDQKPELQTSRNSASRGPNNPQQRTETHYSGSQFAVSLDSYESESQLPELESARIHSRPPAVSNISTNAPPVSLSNEGEIISELLSNWAQSPIEMYAESSIPKMVEKALEMGNRGEYAAAEEIHRQVVKWRNEVQGPEHLDTLSSIYRLVLVLEI